MKIDTNICVQMSLVLLGVVSSVRALRADSSRGSRGLSRAGPRGEDPMEAESTGFYGDASVQASSKYFQYAHVPHKDHYEAGHKRGNDHHFIERHEKAHPKAGQFKTKVRWGDKKGGYGEHYWDYNHAGHGDNHDEGSEAVADFQESEETIPRSKRQPHMDLMLDPSSGHVVDQISGRKYYLQPVY